MGIVEILAWPGAAVIIAIAAMVILRKPLTGLISRIKKVGKTGFDTYPTQIQEKPKAEPMPPGLVPMFDNQTVSETETLISPVR